MLLWGVYPILCKRFRDTDKSSSTWPPKRCSSNFISSDKGQIPVGIVAGTRTKSGATPTSCAST